MQTLPSCKISNSLLWIPKASQTNSASSFADADVLTRWFAKSGQTGSRDPPSHRPVSPNQPAVNQPPILPTYFLRMLPPPCCKAAPPISLASQSINCYCAGVSNNSGKTSENTQKMNCSKSGYQHPTTREYSQRIGILISSFRTGAHHCLNNMVKPPGCHPLPIAKSLKIPSHSAPSSAFKFAIDTQSSLSGRKWTHALGESELKPGIKKGWG